MLPLYTSGMFGQKSYSRILGLVVSINTAGYAVGAPLLNAVFDRVGSYRPALWAGAALMLLITISFQFILNTAHRHRSRIEAAEKTEQGR